MDWRKPLWQDTGAQKTQSPMSQPSQVAPTSASGNNVLSYDPNKRQTSPLAGSLTDYYTKALQGGGVTDATRAKWAEMDDATGTAAAQLKQDAVQPGMFGQGAGAVRAGVAAGRRP